MSDEHDDKSGQGQSHGGGHGGGSGGGHGGGHGGGGGSHEEHEGAPEWLISFADNTALLMGFFVIMLALNMGPKGGTAPDKSDSQAAKESGQSPEALDWAIGVRAAFHNPVRPDSDDPRDRILAMRLRERAAQRVESPHPGIRGEAHKVQTVRPTDFHAISGAVAFNEGSAALTDSARQQTAELAQRIRGKRNIIEIRGHVGPGEVAGADARARLSFDRALAAATALADQGLDWRQLRIIACGDNERLRPRAYTQADRSVNDRVEISVTDEVMVTP